MTEPAVPRPAPAICPWCSADLPDEAPTTCPSCGATLVGEPDAALPGVTAIDADAIVRNARGAATQRRSRLVGWITGEDTGSDEPPAPGSLEPPPPEVRREMLRMELAAEVAELQAEADAMAADARQEGGLESDEQAFEAAADDAAAAREELTAAEPAPASVAPRDADPIGGVGPPDDDLDAVRETADHDEASPGPPADPETRTRP